MRYAVTVNRKYKYVKVYRVVKRVSGGTNKLSEFTARFIDRLVQGKKAKGQA